MNNPTIDPSADPSASGQSEQNVLRPAGVDDVAAMIRSAVTQKLKVRLGSGRNSSGAVGDTTGIRLCLSGMNAVVDYPARDMTITVQAGLNAGQLREILKKENQQLPIDPSDDSQTVGAMVASDVSGPRRWGYSTLRDYLIGMEAVDGTGRIFHAGGRVVKNVAGYDLCRLMIGSRGTLGVLTQLTFKLKPVPAEERVLLAGFRDLASLEAGLDRLNRSGACPVILDVLNRPAALSLLPWFSALPESSRSAALVLITVNGTETACNWQLGTLRDELSGTSAWIQDAAGTDSAAHSRLAEQYCRAASAAQKAGPGPAWLARLTTLPSQTVAAVSALSGTHCDCFGRAGNGVLYVRPAVATSGERPALEESCIQTLNGIVSSGTGTLKVLKSTKPRTVQLSPEVAAVTRSLQSLFDPHQIFADT